MIKNIFSVVIFMILLSSCVVRETIIVTVTPHHTEEPVATETAVLPTETSVVTNTATTTFVAPTVLPTSTTEATPTQEIVPTEFTITMFVCASWGANVRQSDGTNSAIITTLPNATPVNVIGVNGLNTWYRVSLPNSIIGWVVKGLLCDNQLPTPTRSNTATPNVTNTQPATTCNRLSYNINAVEFPNQQNLYAHLDRMNPCVILVMDGIGLAADMVRRYPNAVVIHRDYSIHEGEEFLRVDPVTWVNHWDQQGNSIGTDINKRIVRYSTNEPSLGNFVTQYVSAEVELLNEAARRGYRVASGNFAVGTYQQHEILSGIFDPLIRAVMNGNHYFAFHEYTTALLPFGVGQMPKDHLLNSSDVQVSSWARPSQLPFDYWILPANAQSVDEDEVLPFGIEQYYEYLSTLPESFEAQTTTRILPPYWHILRSSWFVIRGRELGYNNIPIVLTECCWDNLGDIGTEILNVMRSRYGLPEYMYDMRGINSYRNLWSFYWGSNGWNTAQAAYWQLAWLDSIYPSNYIGFAQFTWSSNAGWASFDMSGYREGWYGEFQRLIEGHRRNVFADTYWR